MHVHTLSHDHTREHLAKPEKINFKLQGKTSGQNFWTNLENIRGNTMTDETLSEGQLKQLLQDAAQRLKDAKQNKALQTQNTLPDRYVKTSFLLHTNTLTRPQYSQAGPRRFHHALRYHHRPWRSRQPLTPRSREREEALKRHPTSAGPSRQQGQSYPSKCATSHSSHDLL